MTFFIMSHVRALFDDICAGVDSGGVINYSLCRDFVSEVSEILKDSDFFDYADAVVFNPSLPGLFGIMSTSPNLLSLLGYENTKSRINIYKNAFYALSSFDEFRVVLLGHEFSHLKEIYNLSKNRVRTFEDMLLLMSSNTVIEKPIIDIINKKNFEKNVQNISGILSSYGDMFYVPPGLEVVDVLTNALTDFAGKIKDYVLSSGIKNCKKTLALKKKDESSYILFKRNMSELCAYISEFDMIYKGVANVSEEFIKREVNIFEKYYHDSLSYAFACKDEKDRQLLLRAGEYLTDFRQG